MMPALLAAASLIAGCATTPSSRESLVQYDPNKPQILLAGATVANAKSLAMGAAATNGWTIKDSSDDRLVLQRPAKRIPDPTRTDPPAPGALPPVIEVETGFFERPGGVDVVLGADLITNRGTKEERRQDFTERYRDDLMRSLDSLQAAWATAGPEIVSGMPPLSSAENIGPPPTAEEAQEIAQNEGRQHFGPAEWKRPPAPSPAQAQPTAATPAPSGLTAPVGPVPVQEHGEPSAMLALPQAPVGVWSYYAEEYAKSRGCVLTPDGARLVEKRPDYEVHRVHCQSGQDMVVRCNAGSCEETH
jgi:hypothetical protein